MKRVPFTKFGETRLVPWVIYFQGEKAKTGTYSRTRWIEQPEDMYGLTAPDIRDYYTLVVTREDWLNSPIIDKDGQVKTQPIGSQWRIRITDPDDPLLDYNMDSNTPNLIKILDGKSRPVSIFDELVIDKWFHLEQMDHDLYWMRVGNLKIFARIAPGGIINDISYTMEEE